MRFFFLLKLVSIFSSVMQIFSLNDRKVTMHGITFQAVTPLDNLLKLEDSSVTGENKVLLIWTVKAGNSFDHLSYMIGEFLVKKKVPQKDKYFKVLTEIAERFNGMPTNEIKFKLSSLILSLPWDTLFNHPEILIRELKADISGVLYPSPRLLNSSRFQMYKKFQLKLVRKEGLRSHQFTEQRFIAVGYRDKGSSRKFTLAQDASPSWVEVACRGGGLEINQIKRKDRINDSDRFNNFINGARHIFVSSERLKKRKREQRDDLLGDLL
jgi:hypothetical protein